jgi:hypothetical protein
MLRRVALSLLLRKYRLNAERGIKIRKRQIEPGGNRATTDQIHKHVLARLN